MSLIVFPHMSLTYANLLMSRASIEQIVNHRGWHRLQRSAAVQPRARQTYSAVHAHGTHGVYKLNVHPI